LRFRRGAALDLILQQTFRLGLLLQIRKTIRRERLEVFGAGLEEIAEF